jgi:hypothetical protein
VGWLSINIDSFREIYSDEGAAVSQQEPTGKPKYSVYFKGSQMPNQFLGVASLRHWLCGPQFDPALKRARPGVSTGAETRQCHYGHLPQARQHASVAFEDPLYRSEQTGHVATTNQNAIAQLGQRQANVTVLPDQVVIVEADVRKYGSD